METIYYTPDITEFRIGFEFEELFQEKPIKMRAYSKEELKAFPYNWDKLKLDTSHSISRISSKIKQTKVRVKYLDRSDIESLGWGNYKKSIDDWYTINKQIRLSSGHWFHHFTLQHDRNNSFINEVDHCYNIKITADCSSPEEDVLFEGVIKNKSELKTLMLQLGIK